MLTQFWVRYRELIFGACGIAVAALGIYLVEIHVAEIKSILEDVIQSIRCMTRIDAPIRECPASGNMSDGLIEAAV